jgi:hypothetical protein
MNALELNVESPSESVRGIMNADMDNGSIAYAIGMQQPFECLQSAAAQLAGVLILAATGSRSGSPDHPILAVAIGNHQQAVDGMGSVKVPAESRHRHLHVKRASSLIADAILTFRSVAARKQSNADAALVLLVRAWNELRIASLSLPGCGLVDFRQSCCAEHQKSIGISFTAPAIQTRQ